MSSQVEAGRRGGLSLSSPGQTSGDTKAENRMDKNTP